jgi:hypothetical protein
MHGKDWWEWFAAWPIVAGLVYPSQREGAGDRALQTLRKVLGRAGAHVESVHAASVSSQGNASKTFERLYAKATAAFLTAAGSRRRAQVLRKRILWG